MCEYRGEGCLRVIPIASICSVVGMIPCPDIPGGVPNPEKNKFFVIEKMGLDVIRCLDTSTIDLAEE